MISLDIYYSFYQDGKCPQIVLDSNKNHELVHTPEIQEIIAEWIALKLRPVSSYKRTGYGLKHALQSDTGIYLLNEEFAVAMDKAGFKSRACKSGESLGSNDKLFKADLRRRNNSTRRSS